MGNTSLKGWKLLLLLEEEEEEMVVLAAAAVQLQLLSLSFWGPIVGGGDGSKLLLATE